MLTPQDLATVVRASLGDRRLVVVSNGEPFAHRRVEGKPVCTQPPGGVTAALDRVMRATGGLWIALGNGDADHEVTDRRGRVAVPPGEGSYLLKRVWPGYELHRGCYCGMANQALWPLCHMAYQRPVFDPNHWAAYERVNRMFADALAEEVGGEPAFVFIQDYHFGLLPRMIKERCPNAVTAQFWHIPWPSPEVFSIFPWQHELLEGLLDNELLGFQLPQHATNFLAAARQALGARVLGEKITYQGVETQVHAFPISADFESIDAAASSQATEAEMRRLRERFNLRSEFLALGVDRLDYTKGIPERLRALDRFLDLRPDYAGRLTLLQVAAPTRAGIPQYQREEEAIAALAAEINRKHAPAGSAGPTSGDGWRPIVLVRENLPPASVYALYRLADVCIVSSLHDGMNLVAKEFVSARTGEDGALILSVFAGAAHELRDAILINPYSGDEFADAIQFALEMTPDEARLRMQRLRLQVAAYNVYDWAAAVMSAALEPRRPAAAQHECVVLPPPELVARPEASRYYSMFAGSA